MKKKLFNLIPILIMFAPSIVSRNLLFNYYWTGNEFIVDYLIRIICLVLGLLILLKEKNNYL